MAGNELDYAIGRGGVGSTQASPMEGDQAWAATERMGIVMGFAF
jgi:hypothetical protein